MSKIEWTEKVWNPLAGCSKVSEGCKNCYAEKMAWRLKNMGQAAYADVVGNGRWTGRLALNESTLLKPLQRKKPTTYFVNSMSDLFHESMPDEWIDRIFAVMALCPQHTFQVLTKRPRRMWAYFQAERFGYIESIARKLHGKPLPAGTIMPWPLPNVWLGVSVENQKAADERVQRLLYTPAAKRFLSIEPLLGPVDLKFKAKYECSGCLSLTEIEQYHRCKGYCQDPTGKSCDAMPCPNCGRLHYWCGSFPHPKKALHWVIVGGESGPNARPMHPDWARSLRDQCQEAGVQFFFKQWGEWAPGECAPDAPTRTERVASYFADSWDFYTLTPTESFETHADDEPDVYRLGKKKAGRHLDGRTWDEYPQTQQGAMA